MMNVVSVPEWDLKFMDAVYYGYRSCLHIGKWLVFFGKAKPEYDFQWPDLCKEQEREISKLKDLLREVESGWNNFDGAPFEDGELPIMDKVRKAIS